MPGFPFPSPASSHVSAPPSHLVHLVALVGGPFTCILTTADAVTLKPQNFELFAQTAPILNTFPMHDLIPIIGSLIVLAAIQVKAGAAVQ